MKSYIIALLLVFSQFFFAGLSPLISHPVNEKPWLEEWSGTNDHINGIAVFVGGTALTVTNRGEIRRKTANEWWKPVHSFDAQLNKIRCIPSGNIAVAVGEYGSILRSTDSGITWNTYKNTSAGEETTFRDVALLNAHTYLCAGEDATKGVIVRTDDFGWTWTKQTFEEAGALVELIDISFTDDSIVYVLGNQYYTDGFSLPRVFVLRSTNSGKDWNKIMIPSDFSSIGTAICAGTNKSVVLFGLNFTTNQPVQLISTTNGTLWHSVAVNSPAIYRVAKCIENDISKIFCGGYVFHSNITVNSYIAETVSGSLQAMRFGGNGAPNDVILDMEISTAHWYAVGHHGTILMNTLEATPPALERDLDSVMYVREGTPFTLQTQYDWTVNRTEWRRDGDLLVHDTSHVFRRERASMLDGGLYELRFIGNSNRVIRSRMCKVVIIPTTSDVSEQQKDVQVTPLPCNDRLTINSSVEPSGWTLYSIQGMEVASDQSNASMINTTSIPTGAYLLRLQFIDGTSKSELITIIH